MLLQHCNYRIAQIFDGGNFDGYCLFKYFTKNIFTDGQCLSLYTCKCCTVFKQFDGLNFDGLAGKRQKTSKFPTFKILRYTIFGDDCLLYRVIESEVDTSQLQCDLDHLSQWAQTWQMKFNPTKYTVATRSHSINIQRLYYKIMHVLENRIQSTYLVQLWIIHYHGHLTLLLLILISKDPKSYHANVQIIN